MSQGVAAPACQRVCLSACLSACLPACPNVFRVFACIIWRGKCSVRTVGKVRCTRRAYEVPAVAHVLACLLLACVCCRSHPTGLATCWVLPCSWSRAAPCAACSHASLPACLLSRATADHALQGWPRAGCRYVHGGGGRHALPVHGRLQQGHRQAPVGSRHAASHATHRCVVFPALCFGAQPGSGMLLQFCNDVCDAGGGARQQVLTSQQQTDEANHTHHHWPPLCCCSRNSWHRHSVPMPALPCWLPMLPLCAVIVESTYGTQLHGPRETRERLFTESISRTVRAGGRVLLPIVAIGRAQVRADCSSSSSCSCTLCRVNPVVIA